MLDNGHVLCVSKDQDARLAAVGMPDMAAVPLLCYKLLAVGMPYMSPVLLLC